MGGINRAMIFSKMGGGAQHSEYDVCPAARYWELESFHKYMQEHGKHFSKKIAEWAVSKNQYTHLTGSGEYWNCEQVSDALKGMGVSITDKNKYDAYYLANTKYADHASATFTGAMVLQLVADIMGDKDGYDGMVWDMWTAKAMGLCWKIPFQELV